MAFGARGGRASGSVRSSGAPLGSAMLRRLSVASSSASSSAWATVSSDPASGQRSATRRPFVAGGSSAGRRSKTGRRRGTLSCLGRSVGGRSAPPSRADLGARSADAGAARPPHPRSARGHRAAIARPSRGHRAASGALSSDGRLVLQTPSGADHRAAVVRFLRLLLRKMRGKLLLIGDGAPLHRGQPIKDFLARGAAKRLQLEHLPGSAPDLNPVEGIWAYLQRRELGNVCCQDFPELDLSTSPCGARKSGCATSGTSSRAASWSAGTLFSPLYRHQ
jgi:transposase